MQVSKIDDWHNRMDAVTTSFKTMNFITFNKKVNRETWSVGQVVDHLIKTNRSHYETFDAVKTGTTRVHIHGKIGFINRAIGKAVLNSVHPDRKQKIRTFPIWQPATKQLQINLLDTFEEEQDQLKSWMKELNIVSAFKQPVASPANKMIIYPLAAAFEIMVSHEERHLAQAYEILTLLKLKG